MIDEPLIGLDRPHDGTSVALVMAANEQFQNGDFTAAAQFAQAAALFAMLDALNGLGGALNALTDELKGQRGAE